MHIRSRSSATAYRTKDTSVIREIAHPMYRVGVGQSLAEATLPLGAQTEAHFHPCTEELYYVLAGDGVVRIEDEEAALKAGDAVSIPPGARHQIRNAGEVDLVFLCCCTPAYSHEDTVLCKSLF